MANGGRLDLDIVDVLDEHIHEPVDIRLRHRILNEETRANGVIAGTVTITDLRTEPQGLYILEVRAPSYAPVTRFVTIPANGLGRARVTLPIRQDRARAVFPPYGQLDERVRGLLERSSRVQGHEGLTGQALFDAMSDTEKAGLLNIAKKSLATAFKDGADLLPHVTLLASLGDRCFVEIPSALIRQMPQLVDSEIFHGVNGALHKAPDGMQAAGSFKTRDAFGNLQLTFFQSPDACRADVDIDDAAGFGHVFQVARNHLTGQPTHPFNIQQILIAHQHLDPGYRLVPKV